MSERDSSPEADNNGLAGVIEETGMAGFLVHLVELRNRLLKAVLVVLVLFLALFPFRNELFTALSGPFSKQVPTATTMIAVQVASPFFIPLKLTALTAVFIAIPFLLYQLWAFIAPGLYKHERKLIAPLVFSSTILFYLGAAFAYFVVFPVVFSFLSTAGPSDVNFAPDIGEYLSFVTSLFFAFGFVFEVPVAIVLLVIVGVVTPDKLAGFRRYAILIAFIIAAILTPPDVLSQFMMALPIILLYEFGLFVSRFVYKTKMARAAEVEAEESAQETYRADAESDEAVSARHAAYESQAEGSTGSQADEPLDMDRAFDEAEADQRRLESDASADHEEPAPEISEDRPDEHDPSSAEDGTRDDAPDSPSEPSPKKPDGPV
jgi:sec-independent protein translocase protein TatC